MLNDVKLGRRAIQNVRQLRLTQQFGNFLESSVNSLANIVYRWPWISDTIKKSMFCSPKRIGDPLKMRENDDKRIISLPLYSYSDANEIIP